jgi:hypothetical protein
LGDQIKEDEMGGTYSLPGRDEKCIQYLVGKPERKGPLGRPMHRWEESITLDLREIGWEGVDQMHLAQGMDQWQALVNMVMNVWVP